MRFAIYSYNNGSKSAKALAEKLDCFLIKHQESKFKGDDKTVVINWGHGNKLPAEVLKCEVVNSSEAICNAVNKLATFRLLQTHDVPKVAHTTSAAIAMFFQQLGSTIFARTVVEGRDGEGLVVCLPNDPLPVAPLYTIGVDSDEEYRVTVAFGKRVAIQRKVRVTNHKGEYNDKVRTTSGGYGFDWVGYDPDCPKQEALIFLAEEAAHALGLEIAGVDIIWDKIANRPLVLELNTAPFLTPLAAERLAYIIKKEFKAE